MPITETTVFTFPARKGWVVRAALKNAKDMIEQMEAAGVTSFDDADGTMSVQVVVATHLHARGL